MLNKNVYASKDKLQVCTACLGLFTYTPARISYRHAQLARGSSGFPRPLHLQLRPQEVGSSTWRHGLARAGGSAHCPPKAGEHTAPNIFSAA